jgi:hypothetical protein
MRRSIDDEARLTQLDDVARETGLVWCGTPSRVLEGIRQ